MSDTRIVDENVDATKVRLNFCEHTPHLGCDGHIGLNRDCPPSHPGDFGTDCIRSVGTLMVVNRDIGASLSQCDGDCGSNSATAASYKAHSIPEVFHGVIVCAT
jgi:hypothetical protein